MTTPPPAPDARRDVSSSRVDRDTIYRFLMLLFEDMAGAFVEFRFFTPENKLKQADTPAYLRLPLAAGLVEAQVLGRNGYQRIAFGPAPRFHVPGRGRAGQDHDVLEVGCIWAHLEHSRTKGGAVEILRRLRDFPLRPSVVVNTGFAHQVYFALRRSFRGDGLLAWSELMLGLSFALATKVPPTLGQVAALPGTVSLPEPQPVSCTVSEECSSWMRYGVDEIAEALRAAAGKLSPSSGSAGAQSLPSSTVEQLRQRGLSTELLEAVLTGRILSPYAGSTHAGGCESGPDFRLAYALFAHGCSEHEIKSIFRAHPHGCGRRWALKRDGDKYLDTLVHKAAIRFNEAGRDLTPGGTMPAEGTETLPAYLPPGYAVHEDGTLWFHPPVADEGRKAPRPVKVCTSLIHITEIREHIDTGQISVIISFRYLGRTVSVPIPRARMADARQLVASLSDVGAPITSLNARHITAYLAAYEHSFASNLPRKRVTSHFGRGRWDGPFFFPGATSGVEFSPLGPGDAALFRAYASRRGSLQSWLEAMRAVEHEALMLPQVAVLASFVPPLQRRLQIPNFILDLHGNTSTGKSTSLRMAASVYGKPGDPDSLVLQWMNTSAAVERVTAMCSELPVFLDDAQHCPAEMKKLMIYMIANGRGKGRGAKGGRGGISEPMTWHTVALSTSEEPLHESSPHEGARGRILSLGGFTPPFRPGMASFVQDVEKIVASNHGHAGEAYIRHLNGWTAADTERWRRRYITIRDELSRASSSDIAGRVGGYVAAIQLAAELACPLIGLPFKPDVVGAWLALHVNEQQSLQNTIMAALHALGDYYITNLGYFAGDGRYDPKKHVRLHGASKQLQYVGFLRSTVETVFKAHRWNPTAMLNKLAEAGALHSTEPDRHTKKVTVEGVKQRMVCIKWAALLPADS